MWIMTRDGFFSINHSRRFCKPGEVMVRARRWADLARFRTACKAPDLVIMDTEHADYPVRIVAPRKLVRAYLAACVGDVPDNFKQSVHAARPTDEAFHAFLGRVWAEGYHRLDERHNGTTYEDALVPSRRLSPVARKAWGER